MMAEWLSDHDGPVPLAIVGEVDEISYKEGGENATQDSPVVKVFIEGREALGFWGISPSRVGSLRGNGLTDNSLAPPFGQKNAPACCAS